MGQSAFEKAADRLRVEVEMKNTLMDLNNYLFEQIERLNDEDLTDEELERELRKTDSIVKVSEKIIQNGELAFRTMQHMDQYGYGTQRAVPKMLAGDEEDW